MMQTGSLTPTALGWVRDDLDRELDQVRAQVDSIANNPNAGGAVLEGTAERVRVLEQLFHTLVLDGASQIASEMGRLLEALAQPRVKNRDAINTALLEAMVVLPAYLDRLQAGHQDLPLLLLPLINQMRESAGEEPLSEGSIFAPLLDVELPELEFVRKPGFDEPFEFLTGRLHRQYEKALQNWLQEQDDTSLLSPMQGICETMRHRVKRYDLKRLWWVATEVFGGLMDGNVENDVQLRRLLARLGRLIQVMAEEGEDGIDERTSTSITQALLYPIANASPGCEGVDLVSERFQLDQLAPDSDAMMHARGTLSGQDREMYQSLSAAVEDELAIVKDSLDLELRTGQVEPETRAQSIEALHRLADTLSMLGLSGPGRQLVELLPAFEGTAEEDRTVRDRALELLAEKLLLVESTLHEQIETLGEPVEEPAEESLISLSAHEQRGIRAKLLDECVTSMHVAEDAVRERFAGHSGHDPDEALHLVAGALRMANEEKTADLTEALGNTLGRYLDAAREGLEISQQDMETVADAMAALELYLAARRDRQRDASHLAQLVRERLDQLETVLTEESTAPAEVRADVAEPAVLEAVPTPQSAPESAPAEASETAAEAPGVQGADADSATAEAVIDETAHEDEADAAAAEAADDAEPRPAPAPVPAAAEPATEPADELPGEIDPELRDIFLEEYEEVLQELQTSIPIWINQLDNAEALTDIRRAFHTLKGSGRMVGADEIGDFAWQIEDMLNTLLEGRGENFGDASVMVRLAEASLPALRQRMLQEFAGLTRDIIVSIGSIAESVGRDQPADWAGLQPRLPVYLAGLLPSDVATAPAATAAAAAAAAAPNAEMNAMLKAELAEHLVPVRELMDAIAQNRDTQASADQVRAVHTIAGALAMEPEGLDAEIAKALEGLLDAQSRSGRSYTPDAMFTVISAVGQLQNRFERLEGHGDLSPPEEQQELVAQLEHLLLQFESGQARTVDAETTTATADEAPPSETFDPGHSVFAGPADGAAEETDEGLTFEPAGAVDTAPPTQAPVAETPAQASDPDLPSFAPPASEEDDRSEADALRALEDAAPGEPEVPATSAPTPAAPVEGGGARSAEAPPRRFEPPASTVPPATAIPAEVPAEAPREAVSDSVPAAAQSDEGSTDGLDAEIIEIFLEEAAEVLERGETALDQWRDDLEQLSWVQELQREIHTFKGGARMAGLMSIGDFAHEMEELLDRIAGGIETPSLSAVQLLEDANDRLVGWVERVRAGRVPSAGDALALLKQQIQGLGDVAFAPDEPQAAPAQSDEARSVQPLDVPEEPAASEVQTEAAPEPAAVKPATAVPAPVADASAPADDPASGGTIKVAAELLDRLVNASGEVSIYRSRLEQQVGKLKGNIAEFDETINRLSEQFRKMDIEIEAQIRANYPDAIEAQGENFDPLELDQFSALQQATRSLQESVADLLSLQEMAEENLRASEQLLTRQSRVSTELQEGLMKTRMVPFATVAPRLRRIVRGASKEEGKQARLQLQMVGSSDELDRNVLDHIVTPLEHMMRNAVAHGIESPEQRRELGKPAEGEITITVESEATEFVIRIADDGGGIKLDAIRQRAIERGLLDEHAEPSRQQLYAFMMDSGFSTSSSVTRLAGRGVGMDVVSSDIKQIGGSLEIDSEPGQGTQFTIRIPFTLAIMQAIGLEAGDARYLLPLTSVVGVSRIMPDDYRALAEAETPVYKFAGQEYPILDIEPLLGERSTPLGRDNVTLLILSAGEQKAAVRVPELLPHREVVIKPVGPQISSVAGVLGGSISGDGEVMVILDPGPLIRRALIHGVQPINETSYASAASGKRLVMVVDDSITMRKVTSRVLGTDYEVITARDGVDALEQLQDRTPDIMLFDIEMPRMDGYELTERVRDDGRFRYTPIMMITSRAGQKHQDRAMQAGATAYLTKPYREDELLAEVERLLHEAQQ